MMMGINPTGVATGGGAGLRDRAGALGGGVAVQDPCRGPGVPGPLDAKGHKPKVTPPEEWMAAVPSGGAASQKPLLSDGGLRGDDGLAPWAQAYGVPVCPRPTTAPRAHRRWLSAARQVVETTFANLSESFGLKYPGAHSTWGLLMRVSAKVAAYNLGIMINRLLGRPDFAFATLIV